MVLHLPSSPAPGLGRGGALRPWADPRETGEIWDGFRVLLGKRTKPASSLIRSRESDVESTRNRDGDRGAGGGGDPRDRRRRDPRPRRDRGRGERVRRVLGGPGPSLPRAEQLHQLEFGQCLPRQREPTRALRLPAAPPERHGTAESVRSGAAPSTPVRVPSPKPRQRYRSGELDELLWPTAERLRVPPSANRSGGYDREHLRPAPGGSSGSRMPSAGLPGRFAHGSWSGSYVGGGGSVVGGVGRGASPGPQPARGARR